MKNALPSPQIRLLVCCRHVLGHWWSGTNLSAPYWRLYWNTTPGAGVRLRGVRTELGPDRLVLIAPDTACKTDAAEPVDHLFIHFLAGPPLASITGTVITCLAGRREVRHARELLEQTTPQDSSPRGCLLALALIHQALTAVPESMLSVVRHDPRIRSSLALMEQALSRRLPNSELAEVAGMNTNAFIRLFHTEVGCPPQEHLSRHRIEHACLMLHYTTDTIERIAAATGFCDRYHFSKVFKKHRGMGPAKFRRTMRMQ